MNTRMLITASLVATMAGACVAPGEIVRRHDVDDSVYRELGAKYDCTANVGGGTGTLIAPRWILTAAHVAEGISAFNRGVAFGDETRTIDKVILHPEWGEGFDSPENTSDMALLRLDAPVTGVKPVGIYEGDDETGMRVVFVGRGDTGDGARGVTGGDGVLRGAENIVDAIGYGRWVVFDFDAPPEGLEREGISGPGDSGGPALIEIDGKLFTIGVSAANDSPSGVHCAYESREYYARVSHAAGWIKKTMTEQAATPGDEFGEVIDLADGDWPEGQASACARALFDAFNAGTAEALAAFEREYRGERDMRGRSIDERVERWLELTERWGEQTPEQLMIPEGGGIEVRTRGAADGRSRSWAFDFEPDGRAGPRFVGVRISG